MSEKLFNTTTKLALMVILALAIPLVGLAQDGWPQTRAERTNYEETSHYADVIAFINALQAKGAPLSLQYIGESPEGKPLPLAIMSKPPVATPAEAQRSGKPIVYVQANIHAGEVEGKEGTMMIMRELSQNPNHPLLNNLIILFTPIYNIDGNEKFAENRRGQGGPTLVGERSNGQGIDLNRDGVNSASNEMQAVLKHVYTSWDPHVMMDLHTTNGSRHGYELTYAVPMSPDTDPALRSYAADDFMPGVRKLLRSKHGLEYFVYGNGGRGRDGAPGRWGTFGAGPRYVTNYAGLRNRIGVLAETTSFLPFERRVKAIRLFVLAVLEETNKNSARIMELTKKADERGVQMGLHPDTAPPVGISFEMISRGVEKVLLEKTAPRPPRGEQSAQQQRGQRGAQRGQQQQRRPRGAPEELEEVDMEIFDRFKPTKTTPFPAAYFLSPDTPEGALNLLRRHGVVVEQLIEGWSGEVQIYQIATFATTVNRSSFGGSSGRITGEFKTQQVKLIKGSYVVRTAQPLGMLAAYLCEAESQEGLVQWGHLDGMLKENAPFPILKCMKPPITVSSRID